MFKPPAIDLAQKEVKSKQEAQVIGQVMQAFVGNLHANDARPLLKAAQLEVIIPDMWYPQQTFVNIYEQLEETPSGIESIVAIGYKTLETLAFPPEAKDVLSALQALPQMYQDIHRGIPEDEGWKIDVISDEQIHVWFTSPYSDYAAFGYLSSIAQRFCPINRRIRIKPQIEADGKPACFQILLHEI